MPLPVGDGGLGEGGPMDAVPLREYVEAIFVQLDRAGRVAEQEREKAAEALRIALERSIAEGDKNLENHITAQIEQIRAALEAADALELERIKVIVAKLEERFEAAQRAVEKAEMATEKRFEGVNEWRGQSLDRERSQEQQMATLVRDFELREVADAKNAEFEKRLKLIEERVTRLMT